MMMECDGKTCLIVEWLCGGEEPWYAIDFD